MRACVCNCGARGRSGGTPIAPFAHNANTDAITANVFIFEQMLQWNLNGCGYWRKRERWIIFSDEQE